MGEHSITGALCDGGGHTQTPPIPSTPLAALQGRAPPPHHPLGGQGGGHGHFKGHYAQPYSPRSIPQLPKKREKSHKKRKITKKKKKGAVPQHAPRARRNVRAQQKPRAAASRVPAGGFCWHSKVTPGAGYFLPDAAVLENFSPSWSRGAGGRFLTPIIPAFRCAR